MWNANDSPNVPAGVISGTYKWPLDNAADPSHGGINKDSEGSSRRRLQNSAGTLNFALARDLSTRHTQLAWAGMVGRFPANIRELLDKCCKEKK